MVSLLMLPFQRVSFLEYYQLMLQPSTHSLKLSCRMSGCDFCDRIISDGVFYRFNVFVIQFLLLFFEFWLGNRIQTLFLI